MSRLLLHERLLERDSGLMTMQGNYVNAGIWTATEPTMGVVSSCLPSLRPLLKGLVSNTYHGPTCNGLGNINNQDHSNGTCSLYMRTRNRVGDSACKTFTRIEETGIESGTRWGHNVQVHGGKKQHDNSDDQISLEEMETPSRSIRVKTEVTLISSERLEYNDQLF